MSAIPYRIRSVLPSDEGFVAHSWTEVARAASRITRKIDSSLFNRWHYNAISPVIGAPTTVIRVAAPPDDDSTIYGFVVFEAGCIHCVYVRKSLRRMGIARKLLEGVDVNKSAFSTWSLDFSEWISPRFPDMRHLPLYLIQNLTQRQPLGATDGRSNEAA